MRSKTILSIAAFIVAFAFSTAFAGLFIAKSAYQSVLTVPASYNRQPNSCFKNRGRYTADKIEVFISQDISNGSERSQRIFTIDGDYRPAFMSSSFAEYADAVAEYADASGEMDESALPQDFQIAWRDHMKAWRDYADYLDAMKSRSARRELSPRDAYVAESHYGSDIDTTWYEVLRIGRTYGAEVY